MTKIEIIEVTNDLIEFECVDCGVRQEIVADMYDIQKMVSDISDGANPFEDGWEDGIGNTITCDCE